MGELVTTGLEAEQIDFARPSITDDDVAAVQRVLEGGWLTTGEECEQLENELSAHLGGPYVAAVSSCTAALEIGLAWLDLPAGIGVAVPTWTFAATGLAAHRAGAVPVLVDVDPETLNMDPHSLERALDTREIGAVIPVHFAGVPVSPDVRTVCENAGVPVLEDAAHAFGASQDGEMVNGSSVVGACYSFYVTKNLTCGEGGALATWDADFADFARSYRLHGLDRDAWSRYRPGGKATYDIVHPGIKANLPDLLATLARSQLRRFGDHQAVRRELVNRYRMNLEGTIVRVVPDQPVAGSADHLMVVDIGPRADREAVRSTLTAARVSSSVHFTPLHEFTWFRQHAEIVCGGLPVADEFAPRMLSLPLHVGLTVENVDHICTVLVDAVERANLVRDP